MLTSANADQAFWYQHLSNPQDFHQWLLLAERLYLHILYRYVTGQSGNSGSYSHTTDTAAGPTNTTEVQIRIFILSYYSMQTFWYHPTKHRGVGDVRTEKLHSFVLCVVPLLVSTVTKLIAINLIGKWDFYAGDHIRRDSNAYIKEVAWVHWWPQALCICSVTAEFPIAINSAAHTQNHCKCKRKCNYIPKFKSDQKWMDPSLFQGP